MPNDIEKRLWDAADQLRANSGLKSSEYSKPVLGLIFLKFADYKFTLAESELSGKSTGRRKIGKPDYQAKGVMYLPEDARYSRLVGLPEGSNIGQEINNAMKAIERENTDLKDVLPKTYNRFENSILFSLLRNFNIKLDAIEGDFFGKTYEYFLGKFAMSEGQGGGEFFTPTSIVKLIVEIIEPYHGRILDPACGSGGMFVQCANFVLQHQKNPNNEISIYGQEKVLDTIRLAKMNLAVHGLSGDIRQGITYYNDTHNSVGRFDFVMANPPFNVDGVDKEKIVNDKRYHLGMPTADNANYLWIQNFNSALNDTGRAGFVMANSAGDAELDLRRKLITDNVVDVIISVGSNMFYTVTLPCTLWFLDKGKRGTRRKDKILFIDSRQVYNQIDRSHREYLPEQIEFLSNIVRLYRGEEPEFKEGSKKLVSEKFSKGQYVDVKGLCKIVSIKDIENERYSLNPGRYVGVADGPPPDYDFIEKLEEYNERLELLGQESILLEKNIKDNLEKIVDAR